MAESSWTQGFAEFQAGLDVDQVECRAVLDGAANFDSGIRDERIAGVVDDALIEPGNSWAERQEMLEDMSGAVAREVQRRFATMKGAYPFHVRAGSIIHSPSTTGVYEFCLFVARKPTGRSKMGISLSAIFEWIARDVMTAHFGAGARGFRTGAPVYPFEGRGVRTRETFQKLEAQCGEFRWSPIPDFPDDPAPQYLKDCGLDIVVWKPWLDKRPGHFFAIGQCACGKNDINVAKGRELSLDRLQNWLRPVTWARPTRCFLTALHIPNAVRLKELSTEAGIVFDRARLALTAETYPEQMRSVEGFDYLAEAAFAATQPVA